MTGTKNRMRPAHLIGTLIYAGGILGLLVIGALLPLVSALRPRPLPDRVDLPGLQMPVEGVQDSAGAWHLRGEGWEDLLYAEGWVHARERLWQMESFRLAGSGRLAEIIGRAGLPADRLMRTLDLAGIADREVEALDAEALGRVQAYCAGVNAWLSSPDYRAPPEFVLLRHTPERWQPRDTALMLGLMSLTLASDWPREAALAWLTGRFGVQAASWLLPGVDAGTPRSDAGVSRSDAGVSPEAWQSVAQAGLRLAAPWAPRPTGAGSNAWAVSGARSASGTPLLAGDPHLALQLPPLWFLVGLHGPGRDVTGVSVPGLPGIVIGRTGAFAWGMTNGMADDQDLYVERPDPEDPGRYLFAGASVPFAARAETLQVRGGAPEVLIVRSTRHGPVVNDLTAGMIRFDQEAAQTLERTAGRGASPSPAGRAAAEGPPITLRWTAAGQAGTLLALCRLLDTDDLAGLQDALRTFVAPSQNVIYADTSGVIAYQFAGRVPLRGARDGTLPAEGWTGRTEWEGYVPFDDLPRVVDPPDGLLVSANQPPPASSRGAEVGHWFMPRHRADRIGSLLRETDRHTPATFAAIQRDLVSEGARGIVAAFLEAAGEGPASREVAARLEGWDGRVSGAEAAPLYERLLTRLPSAILEDELGPEGVDDLLGVWNANDGKYPVLTRLLRHPGAPWWDDVRTPGQVESADEILERVCTAVLATGGPAGVEWSDEHTLALRHPMGVFWPLSALMNRGPFGMDGDDDTVMNSHYLASASFAVTSGSSWRQIVALGGPVRAWEILPGGNGGHFMEPGYDDQISEWLRGRTRSVPVLWEDVVREAVRRLRMVPPTPAP